VSRILKPVHGVAPQQRNCVGPKEVMKELSRGARSGNERTFI
jgi:hypothetical protein